MIKISSNIEITTTIIGKLIDAHMQNELPRLERLKRYYESQSDILDRTMSDTTKPNNKIVDSYASYITDTLTGYFMGNPVSYNSNDERAIDELNMIFEYTDEQDENSELATDASIYGVAYEVVYVDEQGNQRFIKVSPLEVIPIYNESISEELRCIVRYFISVDFTDDSEYLTVEVYNNKEVVTYTTSILERNFTEVSRYEHYYGDVPFVIYKNNESAIGDFERVISIIDAYDRLESDSINESEAYCDSYLVITGYDLDSETVQLMKENRVLQLDAGGEVKWLTKSESGQQLETVKTRLDNDIHKFSFCPNFTDQNFAGNSSGVAMKYKLLGMENVVSTKERKFKKGLQRRIELLSNVLSVEGFTFDWREIDITFVRNLPNNDTEIADMVSKLNGIVSTETLLEQIPFITNVQDELDRLAEQKGTDSFYDIPVSTIMTAADQVNVDTSNITQDTAVNETLPVE